MKKPLSKSMRIQKNIERALKRACPVRNFNVRVRDAGLGSITIQDTTGHKEVVINYKADGQILKGTFDLSQAVQPGQLVSVTMSNCCIYSGGFAITRHHGWKLLLTEVLLWVLELIHPQPKSSSVASLRLQQPSLFPTSGIAGRS